MTPRPAALIVVNPSGNRSRVLIDKTPFIIGRQSDSELVLRDNRVSRQHARITVENGSYFIEDLGSRHGTHVNGDPAGRAPLKSSDRIDFGFEDSYKLTFLFDDDELSRLLQQIQTGQSSVPGGANLSKLRAVVEVARTLQNSLAIEEVLGAVVDAALTITGTERGFLLLRERKDMPLEIKVARDKRGTALQASAPLVSIDQVENAIASRREFLSLTLPLPDGTSVVAVPLVRVRAENVEETQYVVRGESTTGVVILEGGKPDLSAGSGELLQTLALEASTILENARLLEDERTKQRLEEQLDIARHIQQDMLPQKFPTEGWFRAMGCSIPSHTVGGDYFDLHRASEDTWCLVVADASGKGVGPAILASILQGAFLAASPNPELMPVLISRMNKYVCERAEGERYATLFYGLLDSSGLLSWVNAGHCTPIVVKPDGRSALIDANGLPVGLIESAQYTVQSARIDPGDKIVIYSDGLTDAQNLEGQFFGSRRVRKLVQENALLDCVQLHDVIVKAAKDYTEGTYASDDITVLVVEYYQPSQPV
jgi:sigma-B regulation protein RsbU (phosphoserine phosphatase)